MRHLLLKRRWRVAFYVGGCVAVCAVWALLYGLPQISKLNSTWQELRQAKITCDRLAQEAKNLPTELKRILETESALDGALAALPQEDGIPDVTRHFSERANSFGLDVVGADLDVATIFGPVHEGGTPGLLEVPFEIIVLGRYGEIGRFLEEITELGDYVECESIALDRSPGVSNRVEATISIKLYALAAESQETPGGEAVAWAEKTTAGRAQ